MPALRSAARRAPRASAIATRAAVLRAALDAFSRRGFDAVTTREIAAAAGLEQGHLAYYFASKETLWRETVANFNTELEALLPTEQTYLSSTAISLLEPLLCFFANNRPLTRLMLQEFTLRSSRHDWLVEQYGRLAWERYQPLFAALAAKRGAEVDAAQLYFAFLGGALLYFGSGEEVHAIAGHTANDGTFIAMHLQVFGC